MSAGGVIRPRAGFCLWSNAASWEEIESAVRLIDRTGYASLWTWDHLYSPEGAPELPIFDGWTTAAVWAGVTSSASIGLMVGANTFRNPGLVAKAAVTLDHASRGRAVLGIGAAWFALEHEAHGIEFGGSPGERLDWLEESVAIIKGLMRGETTDAGRHYQFRGARHSPLPYRGAGTLPVMVGGSGLRRTLRIVARFADSWHTVGSVEEIDGQLAALAEHCAAVGRDPGSIDLMFGPQIVIRSDRSIARLAHAAMLARYQIDVPGPDLAWHGPPDYIAERWRPYLDRGFDHLVVSLPAPFDTETIERMAEVVALLS